MSSIADLITSKLETLETKSLKTIMHSIETILDARLDTRPRVGKNVTFDARGRSFGGVITKVNRTTANVKVTSPPDAAGMNWRVGLTILNVEGVERAVVRSKPVTPSVSPAVTYGEDAW